jgi:mannose-1-phosphate guanylyltransferase
LTGAPNAIVLAAGRGTRIAEISGATPKPMLPIAGQPVLLRNLRWLREQGIERVWINLHHAPDAIRAVIADGRAIGLDLNYVYEPTLLGTAATVANIAGEWASTFAVVYGDNLISASLGPMMETHLRSGAPVTIGIFDRRIAPNTGIAGGTVAVDRRGRVIEFREGIAGGTTDFVNAGLYLADPAIVEHIRHGRCRDFATELFPQMLARRIPIHSHPIDGYCMGIDTPQSYRRLLEIVSNKEIALH